MKNISNQIGCLLERFPARNIDTLDSFLKEVLHAVPIPPTHSMFADEWLSTTGNITVYGIYKSCVLQLLWGNLESIEEVYESSTYHEITGIGQKDFQWIEMMGGLIFIETNEEKIVTKCHATLYDTERIDAILSLFRGSRQVLFECDNGHYFTYTMNRTMKLLEQMDLLDLIESYFTPVDSKIRKDASEY